MDEAPRPITGHCLCGSVTYSADAEPAVQAVCHCTDCQRQTGNPFSVIVGVPRASSSDPALRKIRSGATAATLKTGEPQAEQKLRSVSPPWSSPVVANEASVAPSTLNEGRRYTSHRAGATSSSASPS